MWAFAGNHPLLFTSIVVVGIIAIWSMTNTALDAWVRK